eukprot:Selendium_serpulae@DN1428_c0_g1_i1.p2
MGVDNRPSRLRALLSVLLLCAALADAKKVTGSVEFNSGKFDDFIAKFALSPRAVGQVSGRFVTRNEPTASLAIMVYNDFDWPYAKERDNCHKRSELADGRHGVKFERDDAATEPRWVGALDAAPLAKSGMTSKPRYLYLVLMDCSFAKRFDANEAAAGETRVEYEVVM